jgi:hypothetical protein
VSHPTSRGHYVYALIDPRTSQIRYVGKHSGYVNSRLRGHLYEACNGHRHNHRLAWLRQLLALGLEPSVQVLATASTAVDLIPLEQAWITGLRLVGMDLTNGTDGGEGMPNPSEQTRVKLRGRPQVGWSPAAREAARQKMLSRWADPAWRAKMSEVQARRVPSQPRPGHRLAEFGAAGFAEWKKENARQMTQDRVERERERGISKTPEHRAKLSASGKRLYAEGYEHPMKGRKHSEETRTKMRAAWERRRARSLPRELSAGSTPGDEPMVD